MVPGLIAAVEIMRENPRIHKLILEGSIAELKKKWKSQLHIQNAKHESIFDCIDSKWSHHQRYGDESFQQILRIWPGIAEILVWS